MANARRKERPRPGYSTNGGSRPGACMTQCPLTGPAALRTLRRSARGWASKSPLTKVVPGASPALQGRVSQCRSDRSALGFDVLPDGGKGCAAGRGGEVGRRGRGGTKPGCENAFLESHSWSEYASWHLALTEGANDETKARYAFVYGDFRRVHRAALIACVYRAAEWRHKAVELAAHDLLQHLDQTSG
jgi:hypothetical protein